MQSFSFLLRSRAQSDGKIVQIRRVNEEGLGRGRKKESRAHDRKRLMAFWKTGF